MEPSAKDTLLEKLELEIRWQWKWEKKYRRFYYSVAWVSWFSSFVILVLSFYQIQLGNVLEKWVILSIAALAMLSVSLPVLSMTLRFQQRQEVYGRMAREYEVIRMKLLTGVISVESAIAEFERIHSLPTKRVIRETP